MRKFIEKVRTTILEGERLREDRREKIMEKLSGNPKYVSLIFALQLDKISETVEVLDQLIADEVRKDPSIEDYIFSYLFNRKDSAKAQEIAEKIGYSERKIQSALAWMMSENVVWGASGQYGLTGETDLGGREMFPLECFVEEPDGEIIGDNFGNAETVDRSSPFEPDLQESTPQDSNPLDSVLPETPIDFGADPFGDPIVAPMNKAPLGRRTENVEQLRDLLNEAISMFKEFEKSVYKDPIDKVDARLELIDYWTGCFDDHGFDRIARKIKGDAGKIIERLEKELDSLPKTGKKECPFPEVFGDEKEKPKKEKKKSKKFWEQKSLLWYENFDLARLALFCYIGGPFLTVMYFKIDPTIAIIPSILTLAVTLIPAVWITKFLWRKYREERERKSDEKSKGSTDKFPIL